MSSILLQNIRVLLKYFSNQPQLFARPGGGKVAPNLFGAGVSLDVGGLPDSGVPLVGKLCVVKFAIVAGQNDFRADYKIRNN